MSKNAFAQLFQRWIRRGRRPLAATEPTRRAKLRTEELESRLAPATLPPPTATTGPIPLNQGFAPQVAADPHNPLHMVTVAANGPQVLGRFSLDGGASWDPFLAATTVVSAPPAPPSPNGISSADPTVNPNTPNAYTTVSSPDVAFSSNGNVFVTFRETNAAETSGSIAVTSFHFDPISGPKPLQLSTAGLPLNIQVYQWVNQDPAFNPTIAVDTNQTVNPVTGASLPSDSMLGTNPATRTKAVYVAWNTNATRPNDAGLSPNFQPVTILAVASNDEAKTFTSPVLVPNGGYYNSGTSTGRAAPQIIFTPNTTNPNTLTGATPGSLSFVWSTAGGTSVRQATSLPDGGNPSQEAAAAADFTFPGGNLLPGLAPPPAPTPTHPQLPNPAPIVPNLFPDVTPSGIPAAAGTIPAGATRTFQVNIGNQAGAAAVADAFGVTVQLTIPAGLAFSGGTPSGTNWVIVPSGTGQFTATYNAHTALPGGTALPPIIITGTFSATPPVYNWLLRAQLTGSTPTLPQNSLDEELFQVGPVPPISAQTVTFVQNINFNGVTGVTASDRLTDLTVSLAMIHPQVATVRVVLRAPNGNSITLFQNNINPDGTVRPSPGAGLNTGLPGVVDFGAINYGSVQSPGPIYGQTINGIGGVFDDSSPRRINDTANVAPFIDHFRPEAGGPGNSATLAQLIQGLTAGTAAGVWQLEVTDFGNRGTNPPPQFLANWNLHFSFHIQNNRTNGFATATNSITGVQTRGVETRAATPTQTIATVTGSANHLFPIPNSNPILPAPVSPTQGIGPSVSVAYDTGLGTTSPYSGREYMVYTISAGTFPFPAQNSTTRLQDFDIALVFSDDNGLHWHGDGAGNPIRVNTDTVTDNTSTGRRMQFMPSVSVDPTTGTVVVMWYDASFDASDARAATYIATSVDGGQTFSPPTFVNTPKQALNALDPNQAITLEPIPSILANSGPFQFGIRQGLFAYDGRVVTLWTGNVPYSDENGILHSNSSNGTEIYSNVVTIGAGPRVRAGDSGPITAQAIITDGFGNPTTVTDPATSAVIRTYNDTFAPDGTRQLSGFRVVFDRPVLASTFTANDIRVFYQDPVTGAQVAVAVRDPIAIEPVWGENGGVPGDYIDLNGLSFFFPNGTTNAFFIPFQTPQSAVGTYSYSVGPAAGAAPGSSKGLTDGVQAALPSWEATQTPLSIPPAHGGTGNPSITTSTLSVSGVPGGTTLGNVAVTVSIKGLKDALGNSMLTSDLKLSLIGPDATRVLLTANPQPLFPFPPSTEFLLTTFDNNAFQFIDAVDIPLTARVRPDSARFGGLGLAAFIANGTPVNGQWTLEVENDNGQRGVLTGWSLTLTDSAGKLITHNTPGNEMDQNADGVPGQVVSGGPRTDAFSNPAPTSPTGVTTPFSGPYASNTVPLIIPGPQVASTSVVVNPVGGQIATTTSQPVKIETLTPQVGTNILLVTLNRPVDPSSFSFAQVASAFGPNGALTVNSATPVYPTFAPALMPGTLSVLVTFASPPAAFDTTNILSLTGPAGNIDPANLTVAPTTDPATFQIFFPSAISAGGQYTFQFSPNFLVANPGLTQNTPTTTYEIRVASTITSSLKPLLAAGANSYIVTFPSPPGSFTAANVQSIVGPSGTVPGPYSVTPTDPTQVNPTQFRIGFPAISTAGQYLFTFSNNIPIVPGTYTVNLSPTIRPTDGLVLNGTVNAIDVTFDRDIDPTSFRPANVLRITGPAGDVSLAGITITPVGGFNPANGGFRTFQITFPTQVVDGIYSIQLGPDPAQTNLALASIRSASSSQLSIGVSATDLPTATVQMNTGATSTQVTFATSSAPTLPSTVIQSITAPDGSPVPLSSVQSITQLTGTTYRISFFSGTITQSGTYAIQFTAASNLLVVVPATIPVQFTPGSFAGAPPASLPASVVQSITGPSGSISGTFTITQVSGTRYQINFPNGLTATGGYVVQFTAASGLRVAGGQVDTNQNAGLAELRGIDPTATITTRVYSTPTAPGVAIPASSTVNLPLSIPDNFIIQPGQLANQQIQVLMNISFPYDPDVDIVLVAPDGTTVVLFNGTGQQGLPNQANFSNTLLTDAATTATGAAVQPISSAAPPYNSASGALHPQLPLSALIGKSTQGTWTLRVTNHGSRTGNLNNWTLTLPTGVPGTGLGEAVADRIQLGFRLFNQDPSNVTSQNIWTPLGPSSQNSGKNAGQVTSIQVDPSDPSGNTVYAAGASGGVWKTTNFLTTDPAGPHWVPLTDLGPTTSLNVGSIALFARNNDPNQTVVLVGTGQGNTGTFGSGPPTGDPRIDFPGNGSPGVGFLLSQDGGRTWSILDSTVNVDGSGNVLPIQSPSRNHLFVGSSIQKVIIDPTANSTGQLIFYAAVSPSQNGGNPAAAGVWRSNDSGKTWTLIQAGPATDVVLAAGSGGSGGSVSRNLQKLYAGFSGANGGVYFTDSATTTLSMTRLTGGQQNSLFIDADVGLTPVPINNSVGVFPGSTGTVGRVLLATPALTSSPLLNEFYQGWVYTMVMSQGGTLVALYMTKDFGRNWVQVSMPTVQPIPGNPLTQFGTNDTSFPQFQPTTGTDLLRNGNNFSSLAIDPQNPNVVYLGGSNYFPTPAGAVFHNYGLLRVDTTKVEDSQALVAYLNSQPGATAATLPQFGPPPPPFPTNSNGSVIVPAPSPVRAGPGRPYGLIATQAGSPLVPTVDTGWLNVFRDPYNPFQANSTLLFTNVQAFQNRGIGAVVTPFTAAELGTNVRSIVPIIDPVTGQTRLLVGDNQGVTTVLDSGASWLDGLGAGTDAANMLTSEPGFTANPAQTRNGNLQIAQFYSGVAQPSQLAADVAGAMFYGMTNDNGFPTAPADILQTGNVNWTAAFGFVTATGSGNGVMTDQTGSGTAYEFRFPMTPAIPGTDQTVNIHIPTDFFRVITNTANNPAGISRTNGLLQAGDAPQQFTGQWFSEFGSTFAVNAVDPNGLLVSANSVSGAGAPGGAGTGRVFRSTNQGVDWFPVGLPGTAPAFGTSGPTLDNSYAPAVAFGAPTAAQLASSQPGDLSQFLYVGTSNGRVLATLTGGAPWFNISGPQGGSFGSAGSLDGSPVMKIVPNPRPGSTDVFVVTQRGVYYNAGAFDPVTRAFNPNSQWVNITGNLFALQTALFGDPNNPQLTLQFLTSLAVDWRYAIPVDPANPDTSPTFPIVYVAGSAGVYRSLDALSPNGPTWSYYPAATTYTDPAGNQITTPDGGYLPNVMVTNLSLSLGNISKSTGLPEQAGGPNLLYASTWGRGAFAIRLGDPLPQYNSQLQAGQLSGPRVVSVTNPNPPGGPATSVRVQFSGPVDPATFTPGTVHLVNPNGAVVPIIAVTPIANPNGQGADQRNLFDISFNQQTLAGPYTLTIGYNPNGGNVPTITDLSGVRMNQNGNGTNGQPNPAPAGDQFVTTVSLVVVAGPAGIVITPARPGPYRPGQVVTFNVIVRDSSGNQTNDNGPISVSLNPNDPAATIVPGNVVNGAGSFTVTFGTDGTYTLNVHVAGTANLSGSLSNVVVSSTAPPPVTLTGRVAVGSGTGGNPNVNVYNGNGQLEFSFLPFPAGAYGQVDPFSIGFTGGNRVAVADVTGDGVPDIVVGNGPTISSHVLVIDGSTGRTVLDYQPFEASFKGGIYVAVGDITGDGIADIIITPDLSGGPRVQVLKGGSFTKIADFFGINDPNFRGGARAAVGDVTGDGFGDLIVAAGFGGGPRISIYDGQALSQRGQFLHPVGDFFMFESTLRNGVFITSGDVNGDGFADVIAGGGPGGGPRVLALSGKDLINRNIGPTHAQVLANFFAGNINNRGGIRVAAKNLDGDNLADLVVGDGDGAGSRVTAYSGSSLGSNPTPLYAFDAFPGDLSGVYVG